MSVAIPPVAPPKKTFFRLWERDERNQLEKDGSQIHNIRRLAAYGAFALAVLLYLVGVFAILIFWGIVPSNPILDKPSWHIVAATLAALFTVPTVLVLAILKMAGNQKMDDSTPKSVQEALGKMVEKIFDKLSGS